MSVSVALLRGINVGGSNVLAMADLRRLFEVAGCRQVRTYVQSGNVVFEPPAGTEAGLADVLADAIESHYGFRPDVLLRSAESLAAAVAANPYPEAAATPTSLHLFFLEAPVAAGSAAALEGLRAPGESFSLAGSTLYLHAPEGIARSKLAKGLERALGVRATGRNWRTVTRLTAMSEVAAGPGSREP